MNVAAHEPAAKEAVVAAGGLDVTLAAMRRLGRRAELQRQAAGLIANVAAGLPAHKARARMSRRRCRCGRRHTHDAPTRERAAAARRHAQELIASLGGVQLLADALAAHAATPRAAEQLCASIANARPPANAA